MPDYKNMYYNLFNAISEVVQILQEAQLITEEMYISHDIDETNDDEKNESTMTQS